MLHAVRMITIAVALVDADLATFLTQVPSGLESY